MHEIKPARDDKMLKSTNVEEIKEATRAVPLVDLSSTISSKVLLSSFL